MVVMRTIIGGSFTPLNPLRGHCGPSADVRHRRDDNSRRTVQNVRGDSFG